MKYWLLVLALWAGTAGAQCPGRDAAPWVTLGTAGGPLERLGRAQPANALIVGDAAYLFDTGDAVVRQLHAAGLELARLRAVFLTHHHVDHTAGLGPLLMRRWVLQQHAPLPVWGPRGTARMVSGIAAAQFATERALVLPGAPAVPVAATAAAHDIPWTSEGPHRIYEDANISVTALANAHYHFAPGSESAAYARSYAYRILAAGRTIVVTGDTGPSERLADFARGADILISEVIDLVGVRAALRGLEALTPQQLDRLMENLRADHLTSADVGQLAAAAGAGCLVLTHLAPGGDEETDLSVYARDAALAFRGPVHVAVDGGRY